MNRLLLTLGVLFSIGATAQTVEKAYLFDFGGSGSRGTLSTDPKWNNIAPSTESANSMAQYTTFSNLVDNTGTQDDTGIKLVLTTAWGVNGNSGGGGLYNPDPDQLGDLALESATVDYIFNTNNTESGRSFVISGLDPAKGYRFTIFGTRNSTEVRRGNYIITGANSWMTDMQAAGAGLGKNGENQRTGDAPVSDIIFPDAAGNITFWVENHSTTFVPLSCMKMEQFADAVSPVETGKTGRTFFFDFGSEAANRGARTDLPGWNNILANSGTDCTAGTTFANLTDSEGNSTGISLSVDLKFTTNGYTTGLGLPSPSQEYLGDMAVETATYDYFFVDQANAKGEMTFSGLDKEKSYRFRMFASRKATDARLGAYRLEGLNAWTGAMQAAGNALDGTNSQNEKVVLVSEPIFPDSDGKIKLTLVNGQKIYLPINVIKLEELSEVARPDVRTYTDAALSQEILAEGENGAFASRGKNVFELYAKTNAGNAVITATDDKGETAEVAVENLTAGINRITVDLNDGSVSVLPITYFCVEGSAVGGWNTTGQKMDYIGNGVWNFKGELKGYDTNSDSGRVNFVMNQSWNYQFKRASGSTSVLLENDGDDIPLNPGTYDITVNLNEMTWNISNGLDDLDPYRITVMGSSVANGQGAESVNNVNTGYIYRYGELLGNRHENSDSEHPFYISNIAINGNSSVHLLNRFDDLERDFGKWVMFGISLGNEGIHEAADQEKTYNQFKTNMLSLIEKARALGKQPIVTNNYTRLDFNDKDYQAIKRMNDEIAFWDVPSINLLGAIDDGAGHWADGYQISDDVYHPNQKGHDEFFYAMVPSMMDAMMEGKTLTMTRDTEASYKLPAYSTLDFSPDGTVHSFTLAFSTEPAGDGQLALIATAPTGARAASESVKIELKEGMITATMPDNTTLEVAAATNGKNNIVLSQNYARKAITLTNNDVTVEKTGISPVAPVAVSIGDDMAENGQTLGEVMFYRSSMHTSSPFTADGSLNKSSLEVYTAASETPENKAMSTVELSVNKNVETGLEEVSSPESGLRISTKEAGVIEVETSSEREIKVFNIAGQVMASAAFSGIYRFTNLAPGIYLVAGRKVMVR